jgi:DNA polymerase-3 subunit delta'
LHRKEEEGVTESNAFSLIGHAETLRRLVESFDRDDLPHALLFTGPTGIGKSRAAFLLAAHAACTSEAARPCATCAPCRQVLAGTHPDLQIVALPRGKKEIGVDLARALKHFAHLQSVSARRKVAIIDDADRLSIAAQNALLKTLEEPPGHALLILISASPGGLLSTVRSRCQRVVFQPLSEDEVRAVLERCDIEPTDACQWAAQSDGSPGRLLQQRDLWKEGERDELLRMLADLDAARYGSVVVASKMFGRNEQDTAVRLEGLLRWYREEAVRAVAGEQPSSEATSATAATALRRAEVVADALRTMRRTNPNRALLAEALLLRLARA